MLTKKSKRQINDVVEFYITIYLTLTINSVPFCSFLPLVTIDHSAVALYLWGI